MAGINRDLILYDPRREQVPDSEEILAPRLWNKCAMYSTSCLYTEISYASNCRSSQRVFRPIPNTTINTLLNSHLTITDNVTWLDMNEDGDCKMLVLAPSQTHTRRYTCLVLVQSVLVIRMKCVELIMKGWNTKALSCEAKGKAVLHLQLKRNQKKKKIKNSSKAVFGMKCIDRLTLPGNSYVRTLIHRLALMQFTLRKCAGLGNVLFTKSLQILNLNRAWN